MVNIADDNIVEKIKGTGRTFKSSITAGATTFTEIKSLKQTIPFASNQRISIGETPSAFIEAEIHNCRLSLKGYELETNLYIDNYTIPLGLFTVQEPSQANGSGVQKIVAYDRMSNTSKFTYEAKGHTNAGDIFAEICSQCGYSAEIGDLAGVSVSDDILNGYDCRTALGYLAGFLGKNCVVGADGIFKMVGYRVIDDSTCIIDINSLDTLDFPSSSSSVDYIFCTIDENTTVDVGTGENGINIVNPLVSKTEELQRILSDIQMGIGNNYYPAKFKQLNGDPRIEVGDTILVQHRNVLTGDIEIDYVPVMSLVRDFDGGLTVTIDSYEPEKEFYISTTDQIKLIGLASKKNTTRTETVAKLNDIISNALGLYRTEIKGEGGDIKYYYHDADTLENSTYIFTINAGGFAFVTGKNCWNDGDPNWINGITKDGNAVLNMLSVYKLSADLIEAGVIKSVDGNTIFDLNNNVITTKESGTEENEKGGITVGRRVQIKTGGVEFVSKKDDGTEVEFEYGSAGISGLTNKENPHWVEPDGWEDMSLLEQAVYRTFFMIAGRNGLTLGYSNSNSDESLFLNHLSGSSHVMTEFTAEGDWKESTYKASGIESDTPYSIDAPEVKIPNLIRFIKKLTSEDDCNNLTQEGSYYYQTSSVPKNAPFPNAAIIKVTKTDSDNARIEQEGIRYGASGHKKHRTLHEGTWLDWDRNLCRSNIVVKTFYASSTVSAMSEWTPSIDVTNDGYTPVGITGFAVSGSASTRANVKLCQIVGNKAEANIFNMHSTADGDWTFKVHVLYIAD